MKNIIIVDIDTDRQPSVQIGKLEASQLPKNPEEASELLLKDIACLSEALATLILVADHSGYKSKQDSFKDCITHLERSLGDSKLEAKITKMEQNGPIDNITD